MLATVLISWMIGAYIAFGWIAISDAWHRYAKARDIRRNTEAARLRFAARVAAAETEYGGPVYYDGACDWFLPARPPVA